jgi:hypothetical protein
MGRNIQGSDHSSKKSQETRVFPEKPGFQLAGHGVVRPADSETLMVVTSGVKEIRVNAQAHTAWRS